jgi:hypothetical protein
MGRSGETPALLSCEKVAARRRCFRFREQQRTGDEEGSQTRWRPNLA